MRTFTKSIDIAAPAGRVWEVMSDVERWREWTPSITTIRILGGGPFAVGARAIVRQPKLPPALWRVSSVDPGREFTWVSPGPGFITVARHSVAPAAGGSRATLGIELRGPLGGLLGRLTGGITERYLDLEAKGLKARSEDPVYSIRRDEGQ